MANIKYIKVGNNTYTIRDPNAPKTYISSTAPQEGSVGDLWLKTEAVLDGEAYKETYQHNGTDWGDAIPIGTDAEYIDGLDNIIENALDIGQKNADLIAVGLTNTLTLNSSYFSGTAKYDKIGSMVIVYVNVTTLASQSSDRRIENGAIPIGNRPSSVVSEMCRSYPLANLRVTIDGYVYLDYNDATIPSGTEIKGEIAYFV